MKPVFVLLHSLLLGPLTWAPVAARLRARGAAAIVPSLVRVADADDAPFWPRIGATVSESVTHLRPDQPIVLVAHSNAGLLVPTVVVAVGRPVVGCLFVDASLPSRCGPTPAASPERLAYLRSMATQGRLPPWTTWWEESATASLFPDARTRSMVAAEQPRVPLSYYEQQFPVPVGWDHRPCGYLCYGPPYDRTAQEARTRGWDVAEIPGGHLHQLVDPDGVTAEIVTLTASWSPPAGPDRTRSRR
ncbi:alpha/beta fold hydrolase [Micromonospora endolithica]|uniref:Alpha/beta fold hydrolase n=1 Tax=Micromonospora endolithica TaxID=230091 RepID=A0A3A9ZAG4_9ACTN|nr:alpha/beta fold hydrolase [Micromonospora endolithica]RKN45278.1 alpha/beta fold hydrolase [Micromonospora endolithica]TWJ23034.1 alpha/beta hydrolase family protein [Micromonospora endolithica]